jgi:hypothetical protein
VSGHAGQRFDRVACRNEAHELEPRLRARLDALGSVPRAELHFAELLIDCEEDRMVRTVLVGMLQGRQVDRKRVREAVPVRDCDLRAAGQ